MKHSKAASGSGKKQDVEVPRSARTGRSTEKVKASKTPEKKAVETKSKSISKKPEASTRQSKSVPAAKKDVKVKKEVPAAKVKEEQRVKKETTNKTSTPPPQRASRSSGHKLVELKDELEDVSSPKLSKKISVTKTAAQRLVKQEEEEMKAGEKKRR